MIRSDIHESTRGRWKDILIKLGIDPKFLSNKHGPCLFCGGRDRFRFDDKGSGRWYCNYCLSGDGFSLLEKMYGWKFKEAVREIEKIIGETSINKGSSIAITDDYKKNILRRAWIESKNVVVGDPVWKYLNNRTKISTIPNSIRYHPSLRYSKSERYPAMLAVLKDSVGRATTMHRTWIDYEGNKANVDEPKKLMPGDAISSCIRLFDEAECLGIAEGIETALRAYVLFGVPTWSAISANGLQQWTPPSSAKRIVVYGDNDCNFTGQNAAYALARRLVGVGFDVEVKIPDKVNSDWADQ